LGAADLIVLTLTEFAAQGHCICLQGHQPFAAAVRAVHDTLRALRESTPPEKIETAASDEMMKRLTRNGDYARWMKDWL
jgi:oxaloacetate decarboxylase